MVGRCALCSFDLGRGDDGELRKGGHDARSCEIKSFPCFNRLTALLFMLSRSVQGRDARTLRSARLASRWGTMSVHS